MHLIVDTKRMINPKTVTNFERTQDELEEFLLFTIIVAGKNAFQQAEKLNEFLKYRGDMSPLAYIRWLDSQNPEYIDRMLRQVKMGQYNRIGSAFRAVANFFSVNSNITVSVPLLECIRGIGMKTARFFFMHTLPNQQYACLDTHILKWLGEKGFEVPKQTPRGDKYLHLEKVFLDFCTQYGKTPADMDLGIWNEAHEKKS